MSQMDMKAPLWDIYNASRLFYNKRKSEYMESFLCPLRTPF